MSATVIRHGNSGYDDADELLRELRRAGGDFTTWSNAPGDTYAIHSHRYRKHLVCLRGSIVFALPATGEQVELRAGDQLFLPPETPHSATVGDAGVQCAEAHVPVE